MRLRFGVLAFLLFAVTLLHIGFGSTALLSPGEVIREIFNGPGGGNTESVVVWSIRLPRALACLFTGGILGIVGSAFQALFRNPLAEPYVVGVSSGAAVGGALAEVAGLGSVLWGLGQVGLSFLGGLASLGLVMFLSRRAGVTRTGTLLLSGVVLGSMLSALLSLVLLAAGRDTNQLLRWLLGDATSVTWPKVSILVLGFFICAFALSRIGSGLNAMAIGEETARRLGIETVKLRNVVLILGTAAVAATVGAVGVIGFLGLVAPHIARTIFGVDWRRSLPASLLIGSILLLGADALAQRGIPALTEALGVTPVTDIPLGVVTALIGAPSLLILLRKTRDA